MHLSLSIYFLTITKIIRLHKLNLESEGETMSASISLCMIVRDEEETLERCLLSVHHLVDEIIIVDTGSVDNTVKIAEKYTSNIFFLEWKDNFSFARNFSFSNATKDYILWLDADDYLTKRDQTEFKQLKGQLDDSIDSVTMNYHLSFDENNQPAYSLKRNRLVKRTRHFKWIGAVHEYLEVYGKIIDSDVAITHGKEKNTSNRNLLIYLNKRKNEEVFSTRDLFYFANELKDHHRYSEALTYYKKFLNKQNGWIEDKIQACLNKSFCFEKMGEKEEAIRSCLETFTYNTPRAEACCAIGRLFMEKLNWENAIFWFEVALQQPKPSSMAILHEPSWTWIPHLQLTVCYEKINAVEKAYAHHLKCMELIPQHASTLHNESYFQQRKPLV